MLLMTQARIVKSLLACRNKAVDDAGPEGFVEESGEWGSNDLRDPMALFC